MKLTACVLIGIGLGLAIFGPIFLLYYLIYWLLVAGFAIFLAY